MTPQGLDKLETELSRLEKKRPAVLSELSIARDMGDRSENAAYKTARQKLSALDRRILHLKVIIRQASVSEKPKDGSVGLGSTVVLDTQGKTITYTIVGTYESDISSGLLSHLSPLGKNLLRKKKGERVSVVTPKGVCVYEITDVR